MKNSCPFYLIFQVLKVLLIKICKIEPPDLFFLLLFLLAFTSADIIFRKYLELHSTLLSEKKYLRQKFSFSNGFTNYHTPQSLNGQNPLSVTKDFFDAS